MCFIVIFVVVGSTNLQLSPFLKYGYTPTPILKKFFQFSSCNSFFFSFLYIPQIISYYIGRGKPILTPNEIKHTIIIKLSIFIYSKSQLFTFYIPKKSQTFHFYTIHIISIKPSIFKARSAAEQAFTFYYTKIPYYIHHNPSLFFLIYPINNFLLYRERKT